MTACVGGFEIRHRHPRERVDPVTLIVNALTTIKTRLRGNDDLDFSSAFDCETGSSDLALSLEVRSLTMTTNTGAPA